MLELVIIGDILVEYNFLEHVASDVGLGQRFLDPNQCQTPDNLNQVALWTDHNLMLLNEKKCDYQIFTRAREKFASRFVIKQKFIKRKYVSKVLGVWLPKMASGQKTQKSFVKDLFPK